MIFLTKKVLGGRSFVVGENRRDRHAEKAPFVYLTNLRRRLVVRYSSTSRFLRIIPPNIHLQYVHVVKV
jgi:hypothetical protein